MEPRNKVIRHRFPPSGTRVIVYSEMTPDKVHGLGTYLGEERGDIAYRASFGPIPRKGIKATDGRVYHSRDYRNAANPKILMDSGEIVYGYKYWWKPI